MGAARNLPRAETSTIPWRAPAQRSPASGRAPSAVGLARPRPSGTLAIIALAILLTACASPIPHRSEPVPAQCDARCYQSCDTTIPPWRPADPDSPAAWDELPDQVLIPARALLESCETHRQACARCLDRLREAEVIR